MRNLLPPWWAPLGLDCHGDWGRKRREREGDRERRGRRVALSCIPSSCPPPFCPPSNLRPTGQGLALCWPYTQFPLCLLPSKAQRVTSSRNCWLFYRKRCKPEQSSRTPRTHLECRALWQRLEKPWGSDVTCCETATYQEGWPALYPQRPSYSPQYLSTGLTGHIRSESSGL